MRVLVTGGTGFVGKALVKALINQNYQVTIVTRQEPSKVEWLGNSSDQVAWLVWDFSHSGDAPSIQAQDVVINLAGEGIADKRWTESRKRSLRQSRIDFTNNLIQWVRSQSWKPSHWLNASAIGFYGTGSEVFTEDDRAGDDFAAQLCEDWEAVVTDQIVWPCRTVLMRFGVVLGHGGMLKKLKPSFVMGMGATLGTGEQGFTWIHMEDLLRAILWLLDHPEIDGSLNLTAPASVTNAEFTEALAHSLHRPAWLMMPPFVLKLMFGEMAETLLLSGQRVYPKRLEQEGFTFKYPDINTALNNLFR